MGRRAIPTFSVQIIFEDLKQDSDCFRGTNELFAAAKRKLAPSVLDPSETLEL